jgi:hypothetical protein
MDLMGNKFNPLAEKKRPNDENRQKYGGLNPFGLRDDVQR